MSAPRFGAVRSTGLRASLVGLVLMATVAAVLFHLFQRQLSGTLFAFSVHPEVLAELEASLEDQRRLARLDPEHEAAYRRRFEELSTLDHRLQVLRHAREDLVRRYEQILLVAFAAIAVVVAGAWGWRQRRQANRLARLRDALADLAGGLTDIEIGERGRDIIGRIAAMVETTSRRMARDRRRLAALTNLSAWQEAARRHAHEMRAPLTGARLELERLDGLLEREHLAQGETIRQASQGARQELERLGTFTRQFTSFARLPRPQARELDLVALLEELVATFASAWPNLRLELEPCAEPARVAADRDMLRQVLVNLCDNSSQALGERPGAVRLVPRILGPRGGQVALDVRDDGPGVDETVRARLFEPYTTTRRIGEGMGLGLAISKKILLDHDGDLELLATSPQGTTFRLTLPRSPESSRENGDDDHGDST